MFNPLRYSTYYSYGTSSRKHYIRDAIGSFVVRTMSIVYQIIPILIILSICKVINTSLSLLFGIWIGYQVYLFVTDVIDEAVQRHDEKERVSAYKIGEFIKRGADIDGDDKYAPIDNKKGD